MVCYKKLDISLDHIAGSWTCHTFLTNKWDALVHSQFPYWILQIMQWDISSLISSKIFPMSEFDSHGEDKSSTSNKQSISIMSFGMPWCTQNCTQNWRFLSMARTSIISTWLTIDSRMLAASIVLPLSSKAIKPISALWRSKKSAPSTLSLRNPFRGGSHFSNRGLGTLPLFLSWIFCTTEIALSKAFSGETFSCNS